MRIVKIETCNFRQYGKTVVKIPKKGMIGIIGKNGTGKSTFLNSIGFAGYGKIKDVTSVMIKRQGAAKKERCYVEVDFIYEDNFYRIHRDVVSSRSYVQVNGATKATGTTNVTAYVEEEIFKMDYKAFCVCYYAEQDNFDALVKENPMPRVNLLTKLVRIETIDEAAKKTRDEKRNCENRRDELRKQVRDTETLVDQKKEHEKTIASLYQAIQKEENEFTQLSDTYKTLLVQKQEGEAEYKEYVRLGSQQTQLQTQIDHLTQRTLHQHEKRLDQLQRDGVRYEEIAKNISLFQTLNDQKEQMNTAKVEYMEKQRVTKEVEKAKNQVNQIEKNLVAYQQQLATFGDIEETVRQTEATLEQVQTTLQTLADSHNECTVEIQSRQKDVEKLQATKHNIEQLGPDSPCPTCDRPLEDHYETKMDHFSRETHEKQQEIHEWVSKRERVEQAGKQEKEKGQRLREEVNRLRTQIMEKTKVQERIYAAENDLAQKKKGLSEYEEQLQAVSHVVFDVTHYDQLVAHLKQVGELRDEARSLQRSLEDIPTTQALIEETKAEIAELATQQQRVVQELATLAFDEKRYEALSQQIEEQRQRLQEIRDQKMAKEADIKVLFSHISHIDEKLKESEKMQRDIDELANEISMLGKLDEVFKAYKLDKLAKLAPALSDIMSYLMDTITGGRYDQVELDDNYNIFIYRDGVKNPLEFYSGGEKKLAALCQRLAISNLLVQQTGQADFEMLAMDEVFGAMDNERQDSIMEMLRNLNDMFPQILMVTHSEHVKEGFDYTLEISLDEKGVSQAKWLTPWDESEVDELLEKYSNVEEEEEEEDVS